MTAPGDVPAPAGVLPGPAAPRTADRSRHAFAWGVAYAIGAYGLWGAFPLYFHMVAHVPALEVLAHRVVWSLLFLAILITALRGGAALLQVAADRRALRTLACSATMIGVNWGVFIWAVATGHVLDSSLGYFISPLIAVLLGVVVLRERLNPRQWLAVGIAAVAVGFLVLAKGALPWAALVLASSFALYGLLRKLAPADPLSGLLIETVLLTPLAAGFLIWLEMHGTGRLFNGSLRTDVLLILSGPLTALPLILFVAGARRVPLATMGLLSYVGPTGQFLVAVLAFAEPLTHDRLIAFAGIWAALAIFTVDGLRRARADSRIDSRADSRPDTPAAVRSDAASGAAAQR